ncbi:hypothetical protein MESS2_120020 [Mesorhizobium metallidurans STM 2683]|uniref:Uncharacterized protein n=1 Tax=Mesorhizobium metallidurans STM 2683 TaxID=1297569 RepID=M5EI85_9HYPH|nr:hypothetical protein MESS2_120020 [Mesorhizobium metallidurans STM 2683]
MQVVKDLPAPQNTQNGSEQPLSPNDVLEVNVFQVDNLNRTVQVDVYDSVRIPASNYVARIKMVRRKNSRELRIDFSRA